MGFPRVGIAASIRDIQSNQKLMDDLMLSTGQDAKDVRPLLSIILNCVNRHLSETHMSSSSSCSSTKQPQQQAEQPLQQQETAKQGDVTPQAKPQPLADGSVLPPVIVLADAAIPLENIDAAEP